MKRGLDAALVDTKADCDRRKETARKYWDGGLSIVPVLLDGTKAIGFSQYRMAWKQYQSERCRLDELERWFSRPCGIGIIGGAVSGNLEIIDFDDGDLLEPWFQQVTSIASRLPVIDTPSGGAHVYYRCSEVGGNAKIAVDPSRRKQTLIETRGEGGFVVSPGSPPEVHPSGKTYCQFYGPRLPNIPTITPDERRQLWAAARTFSRVDERQAMVDAEVKRLCWESRQQKQKDNPGELTPWDDFNRRAAWSDVLTPHGWRSTDGVFWTRPGKDSGISATIRDTQDGSQVLIVFSGNAGALASSIDHRTWSKFNAHAELNHGGDKRAAARELRRQGYGGNHGE